MKTLPTGLSALAAATLVFASLGIGFVIAQDASPSAAMAPAPDDFTAPATVGFGMDAASVAAQRAAGVAPDYGTFWIGPWTLKSGWGGPDGQLTAMKDAGVTPAVHFYYWGDDISQNCLQNGCWSSLHGAQKTQAGWQTLADQFVQHLNARMGGEPVVVFLETEFNKADVQTWEPLDAMLAEKAAFIKEGYPQAHVVLALGTWNTPAWKTWDRAAAASDSIGIQAMRGSTRDSRSHYDNAYEGTLAGARTAQATFGKPVFLTDLALSSYPEPEYLDLQAKGIGEFFAGLPDLKAAGVHAVIYRSWRDSPNMDLANYYGQAERHWGLAYPGSTGGQKAAGQVWVKGVLAERAGGAEPTPPPALTASFAPSQNVNEWWVDVRVAASNPLTRVEATVDGGAPHNLPKTSWGTWAASFHVPRGSTVVFRAVDVHGQDARSEPVQWLGPVDQPPQPSFSVLTMGLSATFDASASKDPNGLAMTHAWSFGDGRTATGTKVSTTYAAPGAYDVTLTTSNGKMSTTSTQTVTVTQPNRAPTAAFTAATKDLTASFNGAGSSDPDGDALTYAWAFHDGTKATGATAAKTFAAAGTYDVQLTVSDGKLSHTASQSVTVKAPAPAPFTATFTPSKNVNEWWVDVRVGSSAPATRVEATVNGGAPHTLSKTSWGTWAASFHAPRGSTVVFRAYAADGQSAASAPVQWLGPASSNPTFTATFTPKSVGNDWWVETKVSSSSSLTNVQARVNGGMWTSLSKTPYDSYARSIYAPDGAKVEFRATSATGATATSPVTIWR